MDNIETIKATAETDVFPVTPNTPLPEPDRSRLLDRQSYTQNIKLEGENKKIIVNDGTKDIVSVGSLGDGNSGVVLQSATQNLATMYSDSAGSVSFKVAKPGFNVFTATDDELIFNSSQNVFKVVDIITGTFPNVTVNGPGGGGWASDSDEVAILHGQSSVPAFIAFTDLGGFYSAVPYADVLVTATNRFTSYSFRVSADSTSIYLATIVAADLPFGVSSSILGNPAKIYILQETAN